MASAELRPAAAPEPSVGACYRHAGRAFLNDLPLLLVLGLVTAAVQWAGWALLEGSGLVALAGLVFAALVAVPVRWGFDFVCLRAARGESPEGRDLLRPFERHREAAIAAAVTTLLIVGGLALAIVPGVLLWCRLAFVPYLLTDERMSAEEALRESWRLTRGRTWTLLGMGATGVLLSLVGLAALGVGLLPASIWWDLAMASFYHADVEPGAGAGVDEVGRTPVW
jgi:hypothetical protein